MRQIIRQKRGQRSGQRRRQKESQFRGIVSILILVAILSMSVNVDVYAMPANESYTLMVYLNGSDLESDNGFASQDLNEMLRGQQGDNVNVLVYTGGTKEWKTNSYNLPDISEYNHQLWSIQDDEMTLVKEYASLNMGNASTLTGFINDAVSLYPADHYGIILWNHGGGSVWGYGADELNYYDSLTVNEMNKAFKDAHTSSNVYFDMIGFDACLMGNLETAYALKDYSKYMIASEETEPGFGWDYDEIITTISHDSAYSNVNFGKSIIDSYYQHAADKNGEDLITLSMIDLDKIESLMIPFNSFFGKIQDDLARGINKSEILSARIFAESYGENYIGDTGYDMVDLYDFVRRLEALYDDAGPLLDALDETIIYNLNSMYKPRGKGLSVYIPFTDMEFISHSINTFNGMNFSNEFTTFISRVASQLNGSGNVEATIIEAGDKYRYPKNESFNDVYDIYTESESLSIGLNNLSTGQDNTYYALFEEQLPSMHPLYTSFGVVDEDYIFYYGDTVLNTSEYDNGFYKYSGNMVNEWFGIDGYLLDLVFASYKFGSETMTYISYIAVDGVDGYLYVEFYKDGREPKILGYNTDFGSNNYIPLKKGDKLETACRYDYKTRFGYSMNGLMIRDEFYVKDPTLQRIQLPQGEYTYKLFNFSDDGAIENSNWLFTSPDVLSKITNDPIEDFIFGHLDRIVIGEPDNIESDETDSEEIQTPNTEQNEYYTLKDDVAVIDYKNLEIETTDLTLYASDWAKDYVELANAFDLMTPRIGRRFKEDITREEFCELVIKMFKIYADVEEISLENPFTDTDNEEIILAYYLGIVDGYGDGCFGPKDLVTREQIVLMFYRTMFLIDQNVATFSSECSFADAGEFSDWAIDEVSKMHNAQLIEGVGDNKFAPSGNATIEQALKLLVCIHMELDDLYQ